MDIIRRPFLMDEIKSCEQDFFNAVREIIKKNKVENFKVYVAGGWVRDYLLKTDSHDLDMVVDSRIVRSLVSKLEKPEIYKYLKKPCRKDVILSSGYCQGHTLYKLTYKEDLFSVDIRELKQPYTLVDDYNTRDFTINAIYLNLVTLEIEIPRESYMDLEEKTIRCILSPKQTFMDPTRYMRLVRFVSLKDFIIDKALLKYIKKQDVTGLKSKMNKNTLKNMQREILIMFERYGTSKSLHYFVELGLHNYFDLITGDDVNIISWRNKNICRFQNSIKIIKVFERILSISNFKSLMNHYYQKSRRYCYKMIKGLCFALEFYLDGDIENFVLLLNNIEADELDVAKIRTELGFMINNSDVKTNMKSIVITAEKQSYIEPLYFVHLIYAVRFLMIKGKTEDYIIHTARELYINELHKKLIFND